MVLIMNKKLWWNGITKIKLEAGCLELFGKKIVKNCKPLILESNVMKILKLNFLKLQLQFFDKTYVLLILSEKLKYK